METFVNDRSEGERLSSAPVDGLSFLDRLASGLKDLLDSGVECPVVREGGDFLTELLELSYGETGVLAELANILDTFPLFRLPFLYLELVVLACLVCAFKFLTNAILHGL